MSIFSNLIILILGASSTQCQLKEKNFPKFILDYKSATAELEVDAPDAKLLTCKTWKDFPQLLVAEVDLGEAVSSAAVRQTDLFIFKIEKSKLKRIFRQNIREENTNYSEGAGQTVMTENPYRLEKSKEGKPMVRWTRTNKKQILNLGD